MVKHAGLADLRTLLTFLEKYASTHPEFAEALQAAMGKEQSATDSGQDGHWPGPQEYVAEHGLSALEAHLTAIKDDQLRFYARKLKLKLPKSTPLDVIRSRIFETLTRQVGKGTVFAQQDN